MSESSATLPTACVVATLLWWLPQGGYSTSYLLGWLSCALMTYVVLEMTAQNALLRIRSRMVSSLLLLVMAAVGLLHPLRTGTLLLLCLVLSVYYLLRTCDAERPEADTMRAHTCLSVGSLLWPPLLLLELVLLWCQGVFLRSLSRRSFGAVVIGLALPYALWATAAFALDAMPAFVQHTTAIIAPALEPFYWQWTVELAQTTDWPGFVDGFAERMVPLVLSHPTASVALAFTLLLAFTGDVHYLRKSYDDKIRVRMCYYSIMLLQAVIALWIVLQPHYFSLLFPLLMFASVPAAAHFIALTHTWLSNAWVVMLLLLLLAVGVTTLVLPLYLPWPQPSSDLPLAFFDSLSIPF